MASVLVEASRRQAAALEELEAIAEVRAAADEREVAAVAAARVAGLSDCQTAAALGVHRNSLRYRHGARGDDRRPPAVYVPAQRRAS